MADNVTIPATGTGDAVPVVATDQIGTAHHQLVKIEFGVLDSATMVSASNPLPVVQTGTPALPTGAALDATNTANGVLIGAVLETAPVSDTASSGLNGRLQRVAQRLSSLIALLPASLGQKTSAASLAVVVASDQSAVPVSGTVTANAGSGTLAVSAASLPLPTGAATTAKQPALGTAGVASADVLSVQGVASMTALKVDGSAVTQPVSGTIAVSGTSPVSAASLPLPTGTATIGDGRQTVTTAGTAVQFASQACKQVTFTALSTNTGVVAIGASTVLAAAGTRRGVPLNSGDSVTLDLSNVNLAFVDSTVNGEGVSFLWEA